MSRFSAGMRTDATDAAMGAMVNVLTGLIVPELAHRAKVSGQGELVRHHRRGGTEYSLFLADEST